MLRSQSTLVSSFPSCIQPWIYMSSSPYSSFFLWKTPSSLGNICCYFEWYGGHTIVTWYNDLVWTWLRQFQRGILVMSLPWKDPWKHILLTRSDSIARSPLEIWGSPHSQWRRRFEFYLGGFQTSNCAASNLYGVGNRLMEHLVSVYKPTTWYVPDIILHRLVTNPVSLFNLGLFEHIMITMISPFSLAREFRRPP